MPNVKNLEKLRPCGHLETFSTARHYDGYYNNVGLAATYTWLSQSLNSLEDQIYAALRTVLEKHTFLSTVTVNEDKSYPQVYYARLPSIDLRTCVEFRERKEPRPQDGERDRELDELLIDQHNRGYSDDIERRPFWRVVVLTSLSDSATFTVAWIFHHALGDGSSAFLFHDTFLAALNSLGSNPDANPIVVSPSSPLPPPFEELHPMTVSWSYFLKAVGMILFPSVFAPRPAKLWTGIDIPTTTSSPPKFNLRTFALSAHTTKQLALLSRKEGTSVTATIQCLLAASLFDNLPADGFDKVKLTGPMAMRRFLRDVPEDQMTNAIMPYEFLHQRLPTGSEKPGILQHFSWDEARAVKSVIQAELAKEGRDNNIALLKYLSDMHGFFHGALGKPRALTADLSSIGVYKPKSTGQWEIGRMTFSQCANWTGGAFGVNVVTGGDGNASVNFCWCKGSVEEGMIGRVMEGVKRGVEELVKAVEGEAAVK
tara:strand:- start:2977 stop:4428 length:1452 start_codon:yes stop_codon:yes gene_type:complete